MSEPQRYRRRPEPPDPDDGVEAMRFDGTAEGAETIRAWLKRRYWQVYSSVVPPPPVEFLVGNAAYLVFMQANGKYAAAVDGDWLVVEGTRGFRPWLSGAYEFEEYYLPEPVNGHVCEVPK